jgi:hypothetical protein
MPYDDDDEEKPLIEFTEKVELKWRRYLQEFKKDVYPMFEEYGFTLAQAYMAWETNRLKNMMQELVDKDAD